MKRVFAALILLSAGAWAEGELSTRFSRSAAKRAVGKRMRLPKLAGRTLDFHVERVSSTKDHDGLVWTGTVDGQLASSVVLVVGDDGTTTGNISDGSGKLYQIRPGQPIREVDQNQFPKEREPRVPPPTTARTMAPLDIPYDEEPVIDILVAYTPAAEEAAGGEAAMRQLIELGIAETNQGYANSGIKHRLRLAASGRVSYQETGSLDMDLDRITGTDDGYMDEVHPARDQVGADLVSLWVESGEGCGIGWLLSDPSQPMPDRGFNVVKRDCATGYFSFGHEIGHNMGAMHAIDDGGGHGAFPYSFGYKQTAAAPNFRCVMSYDCPNGCERVNVWSSPDVRYRGMPVGEGMTDNRTTLNNTAVLIANYRQSTSTENPGGGQPRWPESRHPYADHTDDTWTITAPDNPSAIYVTFDKLTYIERDYDWIVITDASGQEVQGSPFTGDQLAGKTVRVPGDTARIRLYTDGSITDYGFRVVDVRAASDGARVDLAATAFTAFKTGTIGGRIRNVTSVVQNQGGAPAGQFRIGYYFISAAGDVLFSGWGCHVEGLAPGATYTCGGDLAVPDTLQPGPHTIAVFADDQQQTDDLDYNNNIRIADTGTVTLTW